MRECKMFCILGVYVCVCVYVCIIHIICSFFLQKYVVSLRMYFGGMGVFIICPEIFFRSLIFFSIFSITINAYLSTFLYLIVKERRCFFFFFVQNSLYMIFFLFFRFFFLYGGITLLLLSLKYDEVLPPKNISFYFRLFIHIFFFLLNVYKISWLSSFFFSSLTHHKIIA